MFELDFSQLPQKIWKGKWRGNGRPLFSTPWEENTLFYISKLWKVEFENIEKDGLLKNIDYGLYSSWSALNPIKEGGGIQVPQDPQSQVR
jgi:hypothetical protein